MFAVIKAGAHQFKVVEGDTLTIDRVSGNTGDQITFDKVLMVGGATPRVGSPEVKGAKVMATIKEQKLDAKVVIFKYRRRKNYKVKRGHRQPVTVVEIGKIEA